jgi:hypothetical protein
MREIEIENKYFFKNYSLADIVKYKLQLRKIKNELDKKNLIEAYNLIIERPFIFVPEFNFYRINILIRLGNVGLAAKVAMNPKFDNFEPIVLLRDDLNKAAKVMDLEDEKFYIYEMPKVKNEEPVSMIDMINSIECEDDTEYSFEEDEDMGSINEIDNDDAHNEVIEDSSVIQEAEVIEDSPVDQINEEVKNDINQVSINNEEKVVEDTPRKSYKDIKRRRNSDATILLTKIYAGCIDLREIEEAYLNNTKRIFLTICYYDKYNRKLGLKYIKSIKNQITDPREKKILNVIKSNMEATRHVFFDIKLYSGVLGTIDTYYAIELLDEVKKKQMKEQKEHEEYAKLVHQEAVEIQNKKCVFGVNEPKKVDNVITKKTMEEETTEYREELDKEMDEFQIIQFRKDLKKLMIEYYSNYLKANSVKNEEAKSIVNDNRKIKDEFKEEFDSISKYLYAYMNREKSTALANAFENFTNAGNKSVNDRNSLLKFRRWVKDFNEKGIGATFDDNKFKYILVKEKNNK